MHGVIIYLNKNKSAAVIDCETECYMVISLKKPGQFHEGDSVNTLDLWFGEYGNIMHTPSGRLIEARVECIMRDLMSAGRECDGPELNR